VSTSGGSVRIPRREIGPSPLGTGTGPLVVFAGSFFGWHDVATLLEAFAGVLARRPDARLLLVGDGGQRQRMMDRAAELGITHAVQFTGLVSHGEVPGLLSAADIAVAPYPRPGTGPWFSPLKAFEYMATGLAIVASDVGQLSQVLQHETSGLLVPPGDAPAMAAALQRLIVDGELRRRVGAQARLDAVERHSWERYLARLEHVFSEAIPGPTRDTE
jgi:glycosyltransferase involved in cell wall biosynthesis